MKRNFGKFSMVLTAALLAGPSLFGASGAVDGSDRSREALEKKIRKELVTLPFYNIFDNLSFRVEDGKVTLMGQASRPTLRSDAERVVKRIEGVESVDNQIEVLPLSSFDNSIRLRVMRAIYGHSALNRYALGAIPPIHIIVKNGNVTLEGVVAREMDKNIAFLQANGVSGVFSVKNNLRVEGKDAA